MSRFAKTGKVSEIPVVLVVGGSPGLVSRCWESASRAGAIVRTVAPAGVAGAITGFKPLAIVLTEATFVPLAAEMAPLVTSPAASVVRLASEDVGDEELDGRLRAGVAEADALRRGASGQ